jgi:hypothetical protein
MYRKPNIVTIIEVRRLECAGHLVRMSDDRTVKKGFMGKPDGRRKAGRPKLRWLDSIENDLKLTRVTRDGGRKQKTSVWAVILREVLFRL